MRPSLYGLIIGFVVVIIGFIGGLVCAALLLERYAGAVNGEYMTLMVLGGPFFGALLAIGIVIAVQRRPLRHLLGPWSGANYLRGMIVALALGSLGLLLAHAASDPIPRGDLSGWLALLPVAVPIIFVQTLTEEIVFRGWMQTNLLARYRAQWVGLVIPSVLFGLLHFQGSLPFGLTYVALTFVMGLIAAIITLRTGSIWAAAGLHFGNNLYALLVLGLQNPFGPLLYWTLPASPEHFASVAPWFAAEIAVIVSAFALWLRRAPLQPPIGRRIS